MSAHVKTKCRHRNRRALYIHPTMGGLYTGCQCDEHREDAAAYKCEDCDDYVSLGKASHDDRVRIEIRAAEIAAADPLHRNWNLDEKHGWRDHDDADGGGDCMCRDSWGHIVRNWHSGYLARVITEGT